MLSAALKKKTGKDLIEFLRPRLLDPLGISEIYCARTPGEDSVEHGGGGMKLRTAFGELPPIVKLPILTSLLFLRSNAIILTSYQTDNIFE